jgi:peptide/nickel transport system permease protein
MTKYIVQRLLQTIPVLLGVAILTFSMIYLTPGDPVVLMLGDRGATAEDIERLRHELGLDRPPTVQFFSWISNAIRGDLGTSIRSRRPVVEEIAEMIPSTIQLTIAAELVAVAGGVTMGILAAVVKQPWLQTLITTISLIGLSMPVFWSGLIFILVFSLSLGWLPIKSEGLAGLILPAVTLGLPAMAVITRMTRSSVLEELSRDYIRTARSKGLKEFVILVRHALKNAFIPVLTIIGLQFGGLLSGAFITETVFARPGLGRFTVRAIMSRDFPQVQGTVLLIALIYVFVNLLTDLAYAVFDPRIRYD